MRAIDRLTGTEEIRDPAEIDALRLQAAREEGLEGDIKPVSTRVFNHTLKLETADQLRRVVQNDKKLAD